MAPKKRKEDGRCHSSIIDTQLAMKEHVINASGAFSPPTEVQGIKRSEEHYPLRDDIPGCGEQEINANSEYLPTDDSIRA